MAKAGEDVQGEEENEEEEAKAKRAAIAARMAKLGARGPIGMAARPSPARKPTHHAEVVSRSPVDEKADPVSARAEGTAPTDEAPVPATSPPPSIPIPSLPRRAAPPRRRGQADAPTTTPIDADKSGQRPEADGALGIEPPPQVMVPDEEKPLPKTDAQLSTERQVEDLGRGRQGAEGAASAGIAVMPVNQTGETESEEKLEPVIDAAGTNTSGLGSMSGRVGPTEIVSTREADPQDAIAPGEDVELMKGAERGNLGESEAVENEETMRPEPAMMVPLQSPAEDRSGRDLDENEVHPPLPPRMMGLPLDEVELKHAHEAVAQEEADEPGPAPPTRHPISVDRPLGPRPLPAIGRSPNQPGVAEDRPLPAPPVSSVINPPREDDVEEREMEGEGDDEDQGRKRRKEKMLRGPTEKRNKHPRRPRRGGSLLC